MSGDLNIAVAEFTAFDDDGGAGSPESGAALAESVFRSLKSERLYAGRTNFDIQIRPPKETGQVQERDPEKRQRRLKELSRATNADIIVTGQLVTDKGRTTVTPELYISSTKLTGALELEGYHETGSMTVIGGLDSNTVARREWHDKLQKRVGGTTQLIIALGFYYIRQFPHASREFGYALDNVGDAATKKLVYLFLGNAASKQQDLPNASRYYRQALSIDPSYGRAQLGLAEVKFQQTRRSCEPGDIDIEGLKSALKLYRAALRVGSPAADLPAKVAFGLGRVYVCLSQAEVINGWTEARMQLTRVVEEYDRGHYHLQELASESYAALGFTYLPFKGARSANAQLLQSADAYKKAIELSLDERRQGVFHGYLGFIYARLKDIPRACESYERAAALDSDRSTQYRRKLQALRQCA